MAITVNAAFKEFLGERVNLDPKATVLARSSRDWLLDQILRFPSRHVDFPVLYSNVNIHYGSFARRTKIRELDDLDMIVGISALGTTYLDDGNTVQMTVPDGIALRAFCHDGTALLNSRRLINKFVLHLADVPQYELSQIKRNGAAAVLNLKSYTWSFDIVPGFFTTPEADGRTFYIIPDGNGHWIKTDPRIDQAHTTDVNQNHDGNVLNVIRLIKYWNRRATMPSMSSYLIECIVLRYYVNCESKASSFVDIEIVSMLKYIANAVLSEVQDPKKIQGDINILSWDERVKIFSRATSDAEKAVAARVAETNGNHRESINIWRDVFGPFFPQFA